MSKQGRELASTAVNAMDAARTSLENASSAAGQVDSLLRKVDADLVELPRLAARVTSADQPQRYLKDAQGYADEINSRLRNAQEAVGEVEETLNRTGRPFEATRSLLEQLDDLQTKEAAEAAKQSDDRGQESTRSGEQVTAEVEAPVSTKPLWDRLANLEQAVAGANEAVEPTRQRLRAAREAIQKLRSASVGYDGRDQSAALIRGAYTGVNDAVVQRPGSHSDPGTSPSEPPQATKAARELMTAFRAGTNPPLPATQSSQPAPAEDPRKAWSAGKPMRSPGKEKPSSNLDRY